METGIIAKAMSGFYYVQTKKQYLQCRARGVFRLDGVSPLVGDHVECEATEHGNGIITKVLERKNFFVRPSISNVDMFVIVATNESPVTDPFLIDRVSVLAVHKDCEVVICVNKMDLNASAELTDIYKHTGFHVITTSAVTGDGISSLRQIISGKTSVFTGNSGVGKSSILNALDENLTLSVGEISEKLGRGRHTTRHVELFTLPDATYIADTPGFASFDIEQMEHIEKEELQHDFPEFAPYFGQCRFANCTHRTEPGCAVLTAQAQGKVHPSRHASYVRLYQMLAQINAWERKS